MVFAAEPLQLPGIHNAFRVTPQVFSGSQPDGDAAFAALANLGVKTVISVDGGKPDIAAARKHGIRYIHLPIGYDGVPAARIPELVSAAGGEKIFVHCHHGKHRGPAAVAVICEASAGWSPTTAKAWLREAGTSEEYAGLYRSVAEFRPVTKEQLAKVGPLPEVAITPGLVDAMVAIDERYDALKAAQKNGWKTAAENEATLLWEHFRELARNDDTLKRSDDFRSKLAEGETAADRLRAALKSPGDFEKADAAFEAVAQNCSACHKAQRNAK